VSPFKSDRIWNQHVFLGPPISSSRRRRSGRAPLILSATTVREGSSHPLGDDVPGGRLSVIKHAVSADQDTVRRSQLTLSYTETYRLIGRDPSSTSFATPAPRSMFNPYTRTAYLPGMVESACSSTWDMFEFPTMSLEMVPSILPLVATTYKNTFFSSSLVDRETRFNIRLLRLYLGRELPSTIHELQPGLRSDLGLDVSRYIRLDKALQGIAPLPPLHDVAYGMGRILAQLHYGVGIDGMDIELVLGGDGDHGLRCWVIDYNQCERWLPPQPLSHLGTGLATTGRYASGSLDDGARRLAKRISALEHYYPRPHQSLYSHFQAGYRVGVTASIDKYRPKPPTAAWAAEAEAVVQAGEAFLETYEIKSKESLEAKARIAARRQKVANV